jgi:O-antigen/teichoic acid export membrane protein
VSEVEAAVRLPKRTSLRLNAAASAAGNLCFFAGVFLLTPLAIRHLGSEAWGIWQIVGATTAYAALLNLGLGTTIHQEVAYNLARRDWDRLSRAFTNVRLYLAAAGALILVTLALAGEPLLRTLVPPEQIETARNALAVSVGLIALTLPIRVYLPAMAGLQRSEFFGAFQIAATALMLGGVWLGFRHGMGLVSFAALMTLAPLLSPLACWPIVRRLLPPECLRWRRPDSRLFFEMIRHSLSTLVFSMGTVLLYQTMKLMAAWRCGGGSVCCSSRACTCCSRA